MLNFVNLPKYVNIAKNIKDVFFVTLIFFVIIKSDQFMQTILITKQEGHA